MTTEWGERAIEKVARALYEASIREYSSTISVIADDGEEVRIRQPKWEEARPICMRHARDAILAYNAALREPSEEIVEIGFQLTGDPCWPENVKEALRAMLTRADEEIR